VADATRAAQSEEGTTLQGRLDFFTVCFAQMSSGQSRKFDVIDDDQASAFPRQKDSESAEWKA
jgi:hypothetical protein